ncbi:tyrosine protein phosphatase [Bacillus tianshenii]|nr:tyrosine protein phosphatase [Bacillus tianshenii]
MIDLHCHILPTVDDGAGSIQDSLTMAKQAEEEGIHTIVATPHHKNGKYENDKASILTDVEALNAVFKKEQVDIKVLPGQEVRVYGDLLKDYQLGHILTMNDTGKYLFIEFPSAQVPRITDNLLYSLQLEGVIPVIVHPERNQKIIEKPNILYEIVKQGALTQITTSSLTGVFGKKIQKFSYDLIEANLTHFIASDAHNTTTRPFNVQNALTTIEKKFGTEWANILKTNAEYVVEGKTFYKESPQRIKKKKIFSFLRG